MNCRWTQIVIFFCLGKMFLYSSTYIIRRGASVSACAGLTNQLLSCCVDPCIAWKKHWHSNCRRPVNGGGRTPRPVLLTGAKNVPSGVPAWLASSYLWAFRISLSLFSVRNHFYQWWTYNLEEALINFIFCIWKVC